MLDILAHAVAPVLRLFGLPEAAALSLVSGGLVNCYSGIAAMGPIPLTSRQVTILALMILICHNLVVEGAVQKKSGSSGRGITALRISFALLAGLLLHWLMPASTDEPIARGMAIPRTDDFLGLLVAWSLGTSQLVAKMVVLVVGLTVMQQLLEAYGLVRSLSRLLSPLLLVLGVPRRAAFLWMVANTLGLAYGAAVILDEVESGRISKIEVRDLNRSVAVCHSLLEDTILFVAMGANVLWITIPRLVFAAAVVWTGRGLDRLAHRPAPTEVTPCG
jgi:spore maturation protein SpmB